MSLGVQPTHTPLKSHAGTAREIVCHTIAPSWNVVAGKVEQMHYQILYHLMILVT